MPDDGASFVDWAPPYSGQPNPLALPLPGSTTVSASFSTGFNLTTAPTNSGTITFEPELPKHQPCQHVTATFVPLPGHTFDS